jgi:poly-beta-1,6-N-acetyl-D-glucosamine N-deacetylase
MTLISKARFWERRLFNILCWGFCIWASYSIAAYAETKQSVKILDNDVSDNTLLGRIITLSSSAVAQVSSWLVRPEQSFQNTVTQYAPYIYAYFHPTAWPSLHPRARLAKVPIIMYHDILPQKLVSWDVTPAELEQHFQQIKASGATPVSVDLLATHLRTGIPLPKKPVVLTFDDGYGGHYEYAYPLLKKYNFPAMFAIYIKGVGNNIDRSHVSWKQVKEMASDPLVTISCHSFTHPLDLRRLSDEQLQMEIIQSKTILESYLRIPIRYFTYPVGKFDERVAKWVNKSGYELAFTMDDTKDKFAGVSNNLLAIERIGQSGLNNAIAQAWGGAELQNK